MSGASTSVQNVIRSVNRAGLAVHDLVLQPLASAEAVLFEDERELGVVIIDIGGGTTDVALIREGAVWHTASIRPGRRSHHQRRRHRTAHAGGGCRGAQEALRGGARRPGARRRHGRSCRRSVAASRASSRGRCWPGSSSHGWRRSSRWWRAVSAAAGFEDAATAGFVVTGGTSIMEGLPELAERVLGQPVRRGAPLDHRRPRGDGDQSHHATGVGLTLYGASQRPGARRAAEAAIEASSTACAAASANCSESGRLGGRRHPAPWGGSEKSGRV